MTLNKLSQAILALAPDSKYLLYMAGIQGLFHLGESGERGLHLIDTTPEQILQFVKCESKKSRGH
jgi:hypothetical protein